MCTHTYFLALLGGLGSKDTRVAMSTSSTQVLGSNCPSWPKGIWAPWKNGFSVISRAGAGKVQDDPETSSYARKEEKAKENNGDILKGHKELA